MGLVSSFVDSAANAPTGITYSYSYNVAPRLTLVQSSLSDTNHPETLLTLNHYNADGQILNETLGNQVVRVLGYDSRYRNTSIVDTINSTTVYSAAIGYSGDSNVVSANDAVNGNWIFVFDQLNHLVNSGCTSSANPPVCPGTWANLAFSYVYDALGNRWQQNVGVGGGPQPQYTFDTNNHIMGSGFSYDAAGNVTQNGNYGPYTYDAENRLINANPNSYIYDAFGQIAASGSAGYPASYVHDLFGNKIDYVGSSNGYSWGGSEVYTADQHINTYGTTLGVSSTYFSHADWLKTIRAISDPAGNIFETCNSLPFGDFLSCPGSSGVWAVLHFTGKEWEPANKLTILDARFHDSTSGRFITSDSVGGHTDDPQTMNRYAYVRGNPVTLSDPTGLDFYIRCQGSLETCRGGRVGTITTDANGNQTFTPTVVTSDSIRSGQNSANVDQNGIEITTGGKTYSGEYFDNPASHSTDSNGNDVNHNPIDLQGSGSLRGFSFNINGNCGGACLGSGTFSFEGPRDTTSNELFRRGAFRSVVDRRIPGWDKSLDEYYYHPNTEQYRFGDGPSPHFSLPDEPKSAVPTVGPFHVDKDAPGITHLGCAWLGVGCH